MKNTAFVVLCTLFSMSAHADTTPESMVGTGGCTAKGNDTACWQAAINASHRNAQLGTVAGQSGKIYDIKDTLVICNATHGTVDGHGAQIQWSGNQLDAQGRPKPLFLVIGSQHIRFANFYIRSSPNHPLGSAFEFTSAPNAKAAGFSEEICPSDAQSYSSKNSIEHVMVEGTNTGGLQYGIRFSNRYNINGNNGRDNDMSTIIDTTFYNVDIAAISVEHTQSHQHRLLSVNGYGSKNNAGCFVQSNVGFISSTGGFQGGWGKANFCLDNAYGTFDIHESNSEGSNRMLLVGTPGDIAGVQGPGVPVVVNIQGGRFAVNAVNPDGHYISFNRPGILSVRGLHVNGAPPPAVIKNQNLSIAIQPGATSLATTAAHIDGMAYYIANSADNTPLPIDKWNTIVTKAETVHLTPSSNDTYTGKNICVNSFGKSVLCKEPFKN